MARADEPLRPTSVLDASALIAMLHDEPGSQAVVEAIAGGAAVSSVNWAEVLSKIAADGGEPREVASRLGVDGDDSAAISIESPTLEDCIAIAELRPRTKARGLSLADRACAVLAARFGVPALTADRSWIDADIDSEVRLIR